MISSMHSTTVVWVSRIGFWLYTRIPCMRVCGTLWAMMLILLWSLTTCYTVLVFVWGWRDMKQTENVVSSRSITLYIASALKRVSPYLMDPCISQGCILNRIFDPKAVYLLFISCWYSKEVYDLTLTFFLLLQDCSEGLRKDWIWHI